MKTTESDTSHFSGDQLVISDLSFSYNGQFPIYHGLNIRVTPGEFLVILGPSGCGKTTLLNLLSGFYSPDRGYVRLHGETISPEDPRLGYVFQSSTLFPWLTALGNIEFGLKMTGQLSAAQRIEKAKHYLEMVGLSGVGDYLPVRLSGGMQQRVSLARALVMEPHLLLMDEPFGALDAITREDMNNELLKLWDQLGQTVVFITHEIDEAIYLSDRIIILALPPHGIYREIANKLPRPRDSKNTRTSDLFWDYKKKLIADISTVTKGVKNTSDTNH